MKFENIEAFEKHVNSSFSLSAIYLIVSPQEGKRKKMASLLLSIWKKGCDLQRGATLLEAVQHVRSHSLLFPQMAAVYETSEGLTQEELHMLGEYVKKPAPGSYLLVTFSTAQQAEKVYQQGKQEVVMLDLSSEKPWEEEERRKKWIVQHMKGKKISAEAVELLSTWFPSDLLRLEQEIEKLVCFLGERPTVQKEDVVSLCEPMDEQAISFQFAKELVWKRCPALMERHELSTLLPLVGQLRHQLEVGLKMTSWMERGEGQEEIAQRVNMRLGKWFSECWQAARLRKTTFFQEGLKRLFALEYGLKTSRSHPEVLFTQFCAELEGLK